MENKLTLWKEALLTNEREDFSEYYALRQRIFLYMEKLFFDNYDAEIFDTFSDRRKTLNNETLYLDDQTKIENLFTLSRSNFDLYNTEFERLESIYKDNVAIIGYTGAGTTDLGVTPFQGSYPNIGIHANILNTIVNERFITPYHYGLVGL